MKQWKKDLIEKMMEAGNHFQLRPLANSMGIKQINRQDVEGIISAYLSRRPNMMAYYDDSNNNSLFCGLWFSENNTMPFNAYLSESSRDGTRNYYVVAYESPVNRGNIEITITDCQPPNQSYQYLLTLKANSYDEALKKVQFIKRTNGESRYL